ncbi:MAG TPA: hypothetical protein DGG94_01240 [Micromonosporaceae bacterium]|nr:hypothetical protein [Micromonosporaceae bacterium]HCU48453.1 hypothetical protein [Micromonosporaceae bacterium]
MSEKLILSIYFGYHDSAVTVATPNKVLLHLLAERYFGRKNLRLDMAGMEELVDAALCHLGATISACERILLASWASPYEEDAQSITLLGKTLPIARTGHHRNHAFSGPNRPAHGSLILCFDGGSEDGYASLYEVDRDKLSQVACLDETLLTGKFYGTATQLVLQPHFVSAHISDTGKLLGLSAYGSASAEIEKLIRANADDINELHVTMPAELQARLGLSDGYDKPWMDRYRLDFAHTVQRMWEQELLTQLAPFASDRQLLLTGGCAHNVVANSLLANSGMFSKVIVPAAPGDGGQALGALFDIYPATATSSPYLGRSFASVAALEAPALAARVSADLLAGQVVGLYQNESEIGARALGNRSILALASDPENLQRVSIDVKGREPYRPLGPVALEGLIPQLIESKADHSYLGFAPQATAFGAERMVAAVHVDGTTRIQSVNERQNPVMFCVLQQIRRDRNELALVNTSLNVAGKPIADTQQDAMECFESSGLDVLYIGHRRFAKAGPHDGS